MHKHISVFLLNLLVVFALMASVFTPIGIVLAKEEKSQIKLLITVPTLVAPSGTITDKTPTYKWTRMNNATQYQFRVYKGTSTTPFYTKIISTPVCNTTSCTNTPTNVLVLASYKWQVRAYVEGAWKGWSPNTSFTVIALVPTPLTPSATIFDTTPTYKWTRVNNATQYQFRVYKGTSTTPFYTKTISTPVCNTASCTNTPTNVLVLASYKWQVRAYIEGAWKGWTPLKVFTIESPIPSLLTPHGIISNVSPTYKWTKVTTATMYQIQVFNGVSIVIDEIVYSGTCETTFCSYTPDFLLEYIPFEWKVRAYTGTWQTWSSAMNFIVSAPSFNSEFNGSMVDWSEKAGGTWNTLSSKYLYSYGLYQKNTSIYRSNGEYVDFDYSIMIHRIGDDNNFIAARMGSNVFAGDDEWCPGYVFGYNNTGEYAIFYTKDDGTHVNIQDWTYTDYIFKSGWNKLRVVARGDTFWFSINDNILKTFSDSSRTRGYLGIMVFNSTIDSSPVYIDWARSTVLVTTQ